jgi:hypothetical protein
VPPLDSIQRDGVACRQPPFRAQRPGSMGSRLPPAVRVCAAPSRASGARFRGWRDGADPRGLRAPAAAAALAMCAYTGGGRAGREPNRGTGGGKNGSGAAAPLPVPASAERRSTARVGCAAAPTTADRAAARSVPGLPLWRLLRAALRRPYLARQSKWTSSPMQRQRPPGRGTAWLTRRPFWQWRRRRRRRRRRRGPGR